MSTYLVGVYDYRLVALSVCISIVASYAAFDLARRITTARGKMQVLWLACGSIAMGLGIWAMHYIGMEAFNLPAAIDAQIKYDWPTTLLSLLAAILASGVALYLVSRPTMGPFRTILGSLFMGGGIAAMHYIGMEGMRLPAMCVYSPRLVALSIFLAVVISYAALRLTFSFKNDRAYRGWRRSGSGLVMGLAMPVMHYSGMAAVRFMPLDTYNGSLAHAVSTSGFELAAITGVTLIVLALVFVIAMVDQRFTLQKRRMEDAELQLQTIFDQMKEGIVVMDRMRNIVQTNRTAVDLLGLPENGDHRENIAAEFELFHLDGTPLPPDRWPAKLALQGEFLNNQAITIVRKDTGKTVFAEISTAPIHNSSGEITQIIVSYRDISARLQVEETRTQLLEQAQQFKESSLQLQTVFDHMKEAIVVVDRERNIVQKNMAARQLMGLPDGVVTRTEISQSFALFLADGTPLPPEQWPTIKALRGDFITNQEFALRRNDTGITTIAEISTTPIPSSTGEVAQILLSYRDVTERKQMEEVRTRLAAIVESSEDAIIGKDIDGIVTSWNRGAERIFGYTATEMIGKPINILLPPGHEHEEEDILARTKNGEIVDHIESMRKQKDGKLINVSLSISPIRDIRGKIVGASKIARNITETKQLERQLRQSQKMEAVGQLTGGIAHDFNNLLGVVIGNLDLLELQIQGNEEALKRARTALKGALRGADLTRRLLSFSSNEELRPSVVKLQHSIRNMMELAARAIGPEIKITTHFDDAVPKVFVDAAGLESALLNLVVNARDAMPKGGTINIITQFHNLEANYPPVVAGELKAGRYACISVSDTGCGMSRETIERAFEPFFTTKPRGKGTGLGLAMVYGFVKQSGGTVRIYSESGYGTTVSFYLPLADGIAEPVSIPKAIVPVKCGGSVLVVDDELDLLDVATAYLAEMGYTALEAKSGAHALEVIEQHPEIALMVTDIVMPGGMNGVELAQKVRQRRPEMKIIYCSGFPADALAERSMPLVDGPLLHKPYQRAEFNTLIRQVMGADDTELPEG